MLSIEILDWKAFFNLQKNFASKEWTRPYLHGVYIGTYNHAPVAVATDGKVMGIYRDIILINDGELPKEGVIMQIKTPPNKLKTKSAFFDVPEIGKHCLVKGGEGEGEGVAYRIEGNYPDFNLALPKRKELKNQIFDASFNANQVAKFCLEKKFNHLTLWQEEAKQPIFVSNGDERFTGLLMPCKPEKSINRMAILQN